MLRTVLALLCLVLAFTGCAPRIYGADFAAARQTMPAPASHPGASPPARPSPRSFSPTLTRTAAPTSTITCTATNTPFQAVTNTPILPFTPTPPPTATPTATLPAEAQVTGMSGYSQLLGLSCESRAAADWAHHFGINIHELEFLARLPRSKNPEEGFVGDPNGGWGNIPPDPYGVHAGPVADLLREYGAQARAMRNMSLDELRAELAAGRPVIVWVVGHVEPGKGVPYSYGEQTITVARYEHTVIATGYDADTIQILDGRATYRRKIDVFLKSWGALENMAVVWKEQP